MGHIYYVYLVLAGEQRPVKGRVAHDSINCCYFFLALGDQEVGTLELVGKDLCMRLEHE